MEIEWRHDAGSWNRSRPRYEAPWSSPTATASTGSARRARRPASAGWMGSWIWWRGRTARSAPRWPIRRSSPQGKRDESHAGDHADRGGALLAENDRLARRLARLEAAATEEQLPEATPAELATERRSGTTSATSRAGSGGGGARRFEGRDWPALAALRRAPQVYGPLVSPEVLARGRQILLATAPETVQQELTALRNDLIVVQLIDASVKTWLAELEGTPVGVPGGRLAPGWAPGVTT